MAELFDIVDENDNVISQVDRAVVHRDGLLHREINVYFVTPDKKIIFQMRKPRPPTRPLPILDGTAGGHVSAGEDYQIAALREIEEEVGLKLTAGEIPFITKVRIQEEFSDFGIKNNVWRGVYVYYFEGDIRSLKYERDKVVGFMPLGFDEIASPSRQLLETIEFIPFLRSREMLDIYTKILHS